MRGLLHGKLCVLLTVAAALLCAAKLNAQEAEQGKATLFWDSTSSSRSPRWDLSEEPGIFLYYEQLKRERPNDKVVYVAYGPLGEVMWYLKSLKSWLVNNAAVREDLIYTFDGGREKKLRFQAWLVPAGAEMPRVAGPPPEDENAVIEFADLPYAEACEYCPDKARVTLEVLVEALKERPRRRAYLEFFPCERGAGARREAAKAKRMLTRQGGVDLSRLLVKLKQRRQQRCEAQIWLLPTRQQ
ncbi:MAG TPA: hypothetical protein VJT74_13765 [Pyrinomonadaceae bacterium]|nr:hypothetical protein [Pyrinomonadaceae bacterium]